MPKVIAFACHVVNSISLRQLNKNYQNQTGMIFAMIDK